MFIKISAEFTMGRVFQGLSFPGVAFSRDRVDHNSSYIGCLALDNMLLFFTSVSLRYIILFVSSNNNDVKDNWIYSRNNWFTLYKSYIILLNRSTKICTIIYKNTYVCLLKKILQSIETCKFKVYSIVDFNS